MLSEISNGRCLGWASQRYGDQYMISGIKLLDVLEAAHISPYRGIDDNHPDNGLL